MYDFTIRYESYDTNLISYNLWALTILSYDKKLFTHDIYHVSYDIDNYDHIYSIEYTMYELSLYLCWTIFFLINSSFFVSTFLLIFMMKFHKCYNFFPKYNTFKAFASGLAKFSVHFNIMIYFFYFTYSFFQNIVH